MHDLTVFAALNASQEGGKVLQARLKERPDVPENWSDTLSDVILGAYYDADDREDLVTHLRYCVRELQSALDAVRQLEVSNVPNV